jgi:Cellulase (glycosyl hydrolase family 5)
VGRLPWRGGLKQYGIGVTAVAMVLMIVVAMFGSAVAHARGLKTGFIDNSLFTSPDASIRNTWLDRAADDGAGIIRINVSWKETVTSQPASPTNPADPAYDFSSLDNAIQSANARGLNVMLTVLRAPPWAEGSNRPHSVRPGAWKPDPHAYGQFAQALATRYSGSFLGLPQVKYFEAWNEPNVTLYLAPQWSGKRMFAPERYRQLLNAFYSGIKAAQPAATVIGGAVSPFGDPRTDPLDPRNPRIRPLVFLRDVFCLDRKLKGTNCPVKPHLDVLSQHPINFTNPPSYSAISPDDVEVADFHNVRRVLRAAERTHHVIPGGRHGLWATEFWWFTKPPTKSGIPVNRQARWVEQALYMLWKQGASAVVNFNIRDPAGPYPPGAPSGVFFHDGRKKPSYTSFRFPFVTHRRSKSRVGVWGKAPQSGTLKIQARAKKGWRTLEKKSVHEGGIFTPTIRLRGKAALRGTIGDSHSLVWRQR